MRSKRVPLQRYEISLGGETSIYDAGESVPYPLHEDYSPQQVKMLWDVNYGSLSADSELEGQVYRDVIASEKFADPQFVEEFEASVLEYVNQHLPAELLSAVHSLFLEALLTTCERNNIPFGDKLNFHRLRQMIEEQRRKARLGIKGSRQTSLRGLIKRIRPHLGGFKGIDEITQKKLAEVMGLEDDRAVRKLLDTHQISWTELKELLGAYLSRP